MRQSVTADELFEAISISHQPATSASGWHKCYSNSFKNKYLNNTVWHFFCWLMSDRPKPDGIVQGPRALDGVEQMHELFPGKSVQVLGQILQQQHGDLNAAIEAVLNGQHPVQVH